MEKEKAAEATKTIDAEWKELQMLMSALKVRHWFTFCDMHLDIDSFYYKFGFMLILMLNALVT